MTIDKIDDKKLLISLTDDDMQAFDLRFNQFLWSDIHSRLVISNLLSLAKAETGFHIDKNRLMIEVIPKLDGCMVFFTVLGNKAATARKRFRIKTNADPLIYVFDDFENIIRAVAQLRTAKKNIFNSRVLRYKDKYFLILYTKTLLSTADSMALKEYSKFNYQGKIATSRISEYGTVMINEQAVEKIGEYFGGH